MANTTIGKNRNSALEQAGVENRSFTTPTLSLEEVRNASILRLHSLREQPFRESTPIELPAATGACGGVDPVSLCLRPGEWLLVSETVSARELCQKLSDRIDPGQTSTLDVSDGLALFRLSGPGAPWLLSKLSCLDFLAGKNRERHCARTKMGHIAVVVHYHQTRNPAGHSSHVFDLLFDRSFAKYLWLLLIESADHADELSTQHGDAA